MKDDLAARAREIALTLTSWPSVTGSPGEAAFAAKLAALLEVSGDVWLEPVAGDAGGRSVVYGLKRGRNRHTIVLTGHFDVVPVEDYGELKPLAFTAEPLREAMIGKLRRTGASPLALADLESGNFLPGRGLLDMKAGLAAGMAAMEAYRGDASLLFVGVPDEEDRSAGARAAASRLAAIARARGLDVRLVVNLDAISDQGDGAAGRVVALGSIGKLLLTAFVVGRETHACYPQDGANAAYLAAELLCEFEQTEELAEVTGNEIAAPPTALNAKDLKSGYNVTTPAQAWVYWNTLQHRRTAADVLDIALMLARRAMARAAHRVQRDIPVMSYQELAARLPAPQVAELAARIGGRDDLDLPERCKLVTATLWQMAGLEGPAVIIGFGSVPYPAVSLADGAIEDAVVAAVRSFGLSPVRYFPGISDMSFFGQPVGDLTAAVRNTPVWGHGFSLVEPAGLPCINIGPWGRDYHHWLERLHAPYAFETLPRALLAVIEAATRTG